MCDKCAQSISVNRLLGFSVFGDAVGCVKADASENTCEIRSLGGFLMWNNSSVSGGRVRLNIFVRISYYMWKSLERESAVIFSVPSICCEYSYVLLLKRVQPTHQTTVSCDSAFTESKDALYIQLSALELSMNANMC